MDEPSTQCPYRRRTALKVVGLGFLGPVVGMTRRTAAQQEGVSITFPDQESDGDTIVISEVTAPDNTTVSVLNSQGTPLGSFNPGSRFDGATGLDLTVELDPPLRRTQTLRAVITDPNHDTLAADQARITVAGSDGGAVGMDVTYVEPDPNLGFNYPYFLYAPPLDSSAKRPLLVQPNNTGTTSDDFSVHREAAKQQIDRGFLRFLSDELRVPALIPVFPRPKTDPLDWRHYIHQLDTETMHISDGKLERVDRQLLRMVEHARTTLRGAEYPIDDRLFLDGFSASGNFVNRFAALHPEAVDSVTAGGVNGMPILPIAEADGRPLNYQIGIADVESLTGKPFDQEAFASVEQFIYMGSEDENDTLPFDDAWSENQRQIAREVYGEDMIEDRLPYAETVYADIGAKSTFRVFEGVGHEITREVGEAVLDFHRSNLDLRADGVASDTPTGEPTEHPTADPSQQSDADLTQTSDERTSASTPGFGVGGALTGIFGTFYLVRRWRRRQGGDD